MKALTVYQPWASLIMAGAKPYEFRGWSPRQRGGVYAALIGQRIVIHASTRKIERDLVSTMIEMLTLYPSSYPAKQLCLHPAKALPILERAVLRRVRGERGYIDLDGHGDLPWGVGLGTVVLGEPRNGYDIAEKFGVPHVNDSDRDDHANFGWPMLDINVWSDPLEARGFQGFWNWPTVGDAGL